MSFSTKLKDFMWRIKKSKSAMIIIIVVILIAVATVGYFVFRGENTVNNSNNNVNTNSEEKEGKLARIIDGVWVEKGKANYLPVAVMIENLVSSRPQSGLDKANLVYEVLVEGGITRFLAVYASGDIIDNIGPVRSARTYYLDWVKEIGAVYAHIGGSPEAFQLIPKYEILDLNQFYNSQYFWRSKERAAPHNLYTSSELLARALRDKNYSKTGSYDSWKYAQNEDPKGKDGQTLTIDFSTYNYQVQYVYDLKSNEFIRKLAGEEHKMENGKTIRTKNIVVQFVKARIADSENRLSLEVIGEGDANIYINGKEIKGKWKKANREERTRFYDESGKEVSFNRGTTWIEVIPSDRTVIFE
ncbi:MAG: DUF3048 domain-containing protein [Patescibacteria group bacterium]|nr:DUF3048 domain-containing protein [Patescibacteria group bacterium]